MTDGAQNQEPGTMNSVHVPSAVASPEPVTAHEPAGAVATNVSWWIRARSTILRSWLRTEVHGPSAGIGSIPRHRIARQARPLPATRCPPPRASRRSAARTGRRWDALLPALLLASGGSLVGADSLTPVLKLELSAEAGEITVLHRGRPLAVYQFRPSTHPPHLAELYTLSGTGVLQDTPADDSERRGLMLDWKVNGIDYGQDRPGAGVQQTGGRISRHVLRDSTGLPVAEIGHQVFWGKTKPALAHPSAAVLIEDRTLRFRVDEARGEVALEWLSDFQVGPATDFASLSGAEYQGLGMRLARGFDLTARRMNAAGTPFSNPATRELTEAAWLAMTQTVDDRDVTVAMLADPANPGGSRFYSMLDLYAFLAATPDWQQGPWTHARGDRFRLRWRVVACDGVVATETLADRYAEWAGTKEQR